MLKVAWRNLTHERTRMVIGVAGVALAVLLILIVNGIFVGAEESMVAYINRQSSPLWLMQAGVENMHMAFSMLPPGLVEKVKQIPDVDEAVGVLYIIGNVQVRDTLVPSYIFGIEPGKSLGGPWFLAEGTANLALNQAILDRALARRYRLGLGDAINIRGYNLTIAGLSEGTFGFASNIVFVNKAAMALGMGVSPQSASYILVKPVPNADVDSLAKKLREAVPEANLMTQAALAASDQELGRQMGGDIIQVMNVVAYLIGLLVIGISIYTITLERVREYGILKAIGANDRQLLTSVFAQAFASAGLGYVAGIGLAYAGAALMQRLTLTLIIIEPGAVVGQMPVLAAITALAALLSVGRVLRLDPMLVFQS